MVSLSSTSWHGFFSVSQKESLSKRRSRLAGTTQVGEAVAGVDGQVFTVCLREMTHVDAFWRSDKWGFIYRKSCTKLLFVCSYVWFYLLLYLSVGFLHCLVDLLTVTTAPVMVSASWMNPLAGPTSCPPCCLDRSTTPTDSASSCLDLDPSSAHIW